MVDTDEGLPLAGADIFIPDTNVKTATDLNGDYIIINISPGTYTVVAKMDGYTTLLKRGVVVRSDHTTRVDFSFEETVFEHQDTTEAEPEIILQDITENRIIATSDQIMEVPFVQDISGFFNLQAGVEEDVIRGGDLESAALMMDGLMVVDNRINRPFMRVNLSSIEEMNVIKDGFNAEYGNVRSGLINVVTREGDVDGYHGFADFRFSPAHYKHSGPNVFDPENVYLRPYLDPSVCYVGTKNGTWDRAMQFQYAYFWGWNSTSEELLSDDDPTNDRTPEECRDMFIWLHRVQAKQEWNIAGANGLLEKYGSSLAEYEALYGRSSHEDSYGDKPDWYIDLSLGGPIPFISKCLGNLSFFASHRTSWEAWALPAKTDYYKEQNTQFKLTSRLSRSMKLTLESMYGEINTLTDSYSGGIEGNYLISGNDMLSKRYPIDYIYYPDSRGPFDIYSVTFGIAFDHVISPRTFYNLKISQLRVINANYGTFNSDPETGFAVTDWALTTGENAQRDTTTLFCFGSTPMDESPYGIRTDSLWLDMPGTNVDYGQRAAGARDLGRSTAFNLQFDLTSQLNKHNQIKAGFQFNYDDLYTHLEHIRFESTWENTQTIWRHYPYRFGAYVQDKIELKGVVANIGLRLDYNEPNCDWFIVNWHNQYLSNEYKDRLLTEAPREKAKGHLKISPRLGASFPISAKGRFYFNFGHFYAMPSSAAMYRIEWGRKSDPVRGIGNPDLDLPRTTAYELGFEYHITDQILLHIAGYNRDITDQVGNVNYTNYEGTIKYATSQNNSCADIKGFEISFEKRWGEWITGWLHYDRMVEKSGHTGVSAYYENPNRTVGFEAIPPPMPFFVRPSIRAFVMLTTPGDFGPAVRHIKPLSNVGLGFLFTWKAGRYERWDPLGVYGYDSYIQWKADYRLDIRISKQFRLAGFDIQLFGDIRNVLNSELWSTNAYYGDDYDRYLKSLRLKMYGDPAYKDDYAAQGMLAGNDKPGDLRSDDKPYIDDPNLTHLMYLNPRSVTFGVRMSF